MAHIYLDSSAIVKRYVAEKGTAWIQNLMNVASDHTLYTVRISGAEIAAAFFLRVRTDSISLDQAQKAVAQFKVDFQSHYQIVEITESLVESAINLVELHPLRGYDSIQLAAALAINQTRLSFSLSPVRFVSADNRLNTAAVSTGITHVENPDKY